MDTQKFARVWREAFDAERGLDITKSLQSSSLIVGRITARTSLYEVPLKKSHLLSAT